MKNNWTINKRWEKQIYHKELRAKLNIRTLTNNIHDVIKNVMDLLTNFNIKISGKHDKNRT